MLPNASTCEVITIDDSDSDSNTGDGGEPSLQQGAFKKRELMPASNKTPSSRHRKRWRSSVASHTAGSDATAVIVVGDEGDESDEGDADGASRDGGGAIPPLLNSRNCSHSNLTNPANDTRATVGSPPASTQNTFTDVNASIGSLICEPLVDPYPSDCKDTIGSGHVSNRDAELLAQLNSILGSHENSYLFDTPTETSSVIGSQDVVVSLRHENERLKMELERHKQSVSQPTNAATPLPTYWSSPSDSTKLSDVAWIRLDEKSEEYRCVAEAFNASLPSVAIQSVERIEHLGLWRSYFWRRQRVLAPNSEEDSGYHGLDKTVEVMNDDITAFDSATERYLFHGAHPSTILSVCKNGFDCRLANEQGALGKGTYFADMASYSHQYSMSYKRDAESRSTGDLDGGSDTVMMILSRVALGTVTSRVSARSLPAMLSSHPGRRADSTSNKPSGAACIKPVDAMFVVYHNDQAYPEYVIKYRRTAQSRYGGRAGLRRITARRQQRAKARLMASSMPNTTGLSSTILTSSKNPGWGMAPVGTGMLWPTGSGIGNTVAAPNPPVLHHTNSSHMLAQQTLPAPARIPHGCGGPPYAQSAQLSQLPNLFQ